MIKIENFIGGKYYPSISNKCTKGISPSTEKEIYTVPSSDDRDVQSAINSAKKAFPSWSRTSPSERAVMLNNLSDLILKNRNRLAKFESEDSGKPYNLSYNLDIPRSAKNFQFFASSITQFSSECHPGNQYVNYTLRDPLGVVACISPWNLPLYLLTWKIAPAIACGNCVIAKPSNSTSLTAHFLTELFREAGFPNGVLNVVYGSGKRLSDIICTHKDIKAVSFTGGTKTGSSIAKKTAPLFKKFSLELGGKNASVIFSDCDLKQAVATSVKSGFTNQGQVCLCTSRIFIESSIYEDFKLNFIEKVNRLKVGDPMSSDTDIGPLVSSEQLSKVNNYIDGAKSDGGVILTDTTLSDALKRRGFFIRPTVIEGLLSSADLNQNEIFGPVVSLIPFDNEEKLIQEINSTSFGLAASLWTKNIDRAHRLSRSIDVGIVWVNSWMNRDLRTPFGGTKSSGFGREGGLEVMRFFTEPKNVCISYK